MSASPTRVYGRGGAEGEAPLRLSHCILYGAGHIWVNACSVIKPVSFSAFVEGVLSWEEVLCFNFLFPPQRTDTTLALTGENGGAFKKSDS